MQTVLDVKSVEKSYGQTQVINHCSFKIQAGEIYGLLGINGAGKTTLMKMILGLQQTNNGSIYVLGQEVSGSPEYLSNVGSVIETPAFYEHLSASELLAMHLCYMKKKANIAEILQLVGLENVNQKPIAQYSLGMKQRLGLARAIIHQPNLLILDEPLNGLDPIAITEMRELMKKLTRDGMSILLSSHIIEEIKHTADRVGILSGGYIKQEFSVAEKMAECGERFEDYVIGLMKGN
ncbi:MAG: ATP-binding cassette domain-containing protein [Lachnospiraceae bacterium]|nr:ATP-binding cassette domain-containing protein [Lachnospiraceae bacterium]